MPGREVVMLAFCTNQLDKPYRNLQAMCEVSALAGAQTPVDQVVAALAAVPAGRRALFLRHPLGAWNGAMTVADVVWAIQSAGWNVAAARSYHVELFTALRAAGIVPDLLVIDEEPTYWPADKPELMAALETTDADTAWQRLNDIMALSMRRSISAAWAEVYPDPIPPLTNYQDCWGTGQVDINNHRRYVGGVSTWSAPECYVGWHGIQSSNGGQITDPREWFWRRFIQCLNAIRACGPRTIPWISPACFLDNNVSPTTGALIPPFAPPGVRYLWQQLLQHIMRSGMQRIVYWNPVSPNSDTDDALLDKLLGASTATPGKPLPQLPYDATLVTSGTARTAKATYLRQW